MKSCLLAPALKEEEKRELNFGLLTNSNFLKTLNSKPSNNIEVTQNTVYRSDGVRVEKIIEVNSLTGKKVRVINFDYFDDKKVKSIEEYDEETETKLRVTSFSMFKSVTDFDTKTSKKVRTTNYDLKDGTKKTSVYDYDIETGKIIRVTLYRNDGKSINMIKELDIDTGMVKRSVSYKKGSTTISSISKYEFQGDKTIKTTFFYNTPQYSFDSKSFDRKVTADFLNNRVVNNNEKNKIASLIDGLYKNKIDISQLSLS